MPAVKLRAAIVLRPPTADRAADPRMALDRMVQGAAVFVLPSVPSRKPWTRIMTALSRPRKSPMRPRRSRSLIRMVTASLLRTNFDRCAADRVGRPQEVPAVRVAQVRALTRAQEVHLMETDRTVPLGVLLGNEPLES